MAMNNALTQYLDLYKANSATIAAVSPAVLNTLRAQALEQLTAAQRLPDIHDEGFEKTSINDMFAPDFGVNINRVAIPTDVTQTFHCGVPNLSTLMGIVVNDQFAPTTTLLKNMPEGVTMCSLKEAQEKYPDTLARHYGTAAQLNRPGTALNTLLAQDGVFIHINRGVVLDKALQLVSIINAPAPMATFRRVLLVAEDDAQVAVLKCDHTLPGSAQGVASEVVEIIAGNGARVGWYDIEESNSDTSRYSQVYVSQADGSDVTVCGSTLTNGTTRNEYIVEAIGEHTHTRLSGMAIGSGTQHIDNCSDLHHRGNRGRSEQMFKYVLDEQSTGAFEGSIEVCHGARFVEAYQSNRNILASRDARMHTKPQLLIYNDDVKCSHGATTGQLDSKALFYMQARGIPMAEARRMLMQAFMVDVINDIELEPLRDRLRHMVEQRFDGCKAGCRDCAN